MSRIPCAFSCSEEFLSLVDERAKSLGMKRSHYIVQVLRQDIIAGPPNLNIVADQAALYGGTVINNNHVSKNTNLKRKKKR